MVIRTICIVTGIIMILTNSVFGTMDKQISKEDTDYLTEIARQTWSFLARNVSPETGLPYDAYPPGNKYTSVTNIGFYLASLAVASHLEFLDTKKAEIMAKRALASLGKLKTRSGFQQSWNQPDTLTPSLNDPWISTLDSGNLAAGLIVMKQLMPAVAGECRIFLENMKWSDLYDKEAGFLYGGMKRENGEINPDWHLELIGADSRNAYVIAIGSGQIPPSSWEKLYRDEEDRYGQSYFTPGWQGGGIFMQYISGIFSDERRTVLGESAAQFAYAQILHAKMIGAPVWGWSASVDPEGGYLGWGHIKDDVVTPHASVFALYYFPEEVIDNLRKLDELGARKPFREENGTLLLFGYTDALNWKTGKISPERLTLDQAMLFLTVVNVIAEGIVWNAYAKDPWIEKAVEEIADLRKPDRQLVYRVPGFTGINVDYDNNPLTVNLVNDSDKLIKRSLLVCTVHDRNDGYNKKNDIVFSEKKKLTLNQGDTASETFFLPEEVQKEGSKYFIEIEWLDTKKKRIDKAGKIVKF